MGHNCHGGGGIVVVSLLGSKVVWLARPQLWMDCCSGSIDVRKVVFGTADGYVRVLDKSSA